jgi:hypothetical protein
MINPRHPFRKTPPSEGRGRGGLASHQSTNCASPAWPRVTPINHPRHSVGFRSAKAPPPATHGSNSRAVG